MTEPLTFIPPEMNPWGLQLITPMPSEFGAFELVSCEQASIEQAHQVEVIDEDGQPMRGVVVIFGYSTGRPINMPYRKNYWPDAPTYLKGNAQPTNSTGYAQHTVGEGGEDIWIWDRNKEGDLLYPSAIVKNCTWQRPPVANFNHTGIMLRFQLRRVGFVSQADRMSAIENWIATFNERVATLEGRVLEGRVLGKGKK